MDMLLLVIKTQLSLKHLVSVENPILKGMTFPDPVTPTVTFQTPFTSSLNESLGTIRIREKNSIPAAFKHFRHFDNTHLNIFQLTLRLTDDAQKLKVHTAYE